MSEDNSGKLDKLNQALRSREGIKRTLNVLDLHSHEQDSQTKWTSLPEESQPIFNPPSNKSHSLLKKVFIFSGIFFFLVVVAVIWILSRGGNVISSEKININVLPPAQIPSGEPATLEVVIKNDNDSSLEIADLIVEYPKGTRDSKETSKDLPRERISFGTIEPNQTVRKNLSFIVFAEEGARIDIPMTLEYRVENSLSVFSKESSYSSIVGTSPLSVNVKANKEIISGQEILFQVELSSNSNEIQKNILLQPDFPLGFEFISASPSFDQDGNFWRVGDMPPKSKQTFTMKGRLKSSEGDQKFFRWSVGSEELNSSGSIDAVVAVATHEVAVKRAFLEIGMQIDRLVAKEFTTIPGQPIRATIFFRNNLSVPINDIEIKTKLSGDVLNRKTITSDRGFYNSSDDTVLWSKFENDNFISVLPGEEGSVNLIFETYTPYVNEGSQLKNPEVFLEISVKGKRLSERDVPEEINATEKAVVKVATDARLSSRLVYGTGPIENEGSIPPKVNEKTTYTLIWTVTNTYNDVDGVKVSTILPQYVDWNNIVSPQSEKITYIPQTRTVEWDVGKVFAKTGTINPLRQVAFQLAFKPSLSQVGTSPIIVKESFLTGVDSFAKIPVQNSVREASTLLSTDPTFKFGDDKVIE